MQLSSPAELGGSRLIVRRFTVLLLSNVYRVECISWSGKRREERALCVGSPWLT